MYICVNLQQNSYTQIQIVSNLTIWLIIPLISNERQTRAVRVIYLEIKRIYVHSVWMKQNKRPLYERSNANHLVWHPQLLLGPKIKRIDQFLIFYTIKSKLNVSKKIRKRFANHNHMILRIDFDTFKLISILVFSLAVLYPFLSLCLFSRDESLLIWIFSCYF